MIKVSKYTIANGNSTALVEGCPVAKRLETSRQLLNEVEQVGFIDQKNRSLQMMGDELCVNATIALAFKLGGSAKLQTTGTLSPVIYSNKAGLTTISLTLKSKVDNNIVLFNKIGFVIIAENEFFDDSLLSKLADKYNLPAFGRIKFKDNKIYPVVYVKETKSQVTETACGSGSIAFSLLSGLNKIIQPTGQTITVEKNGSTFKISAKVMKIN